MDWKIGEITRDEYQRMKAKFESQEKQLKEAVGHLQEENQIMAQGIRTDTPYLTTFLKYKNIDHLERGILAELLDVILIHENGEIEVRFNFADQYQRIIEFIDNNHRELTVIEGNIGWHSLDALYFQKTCCGYITSPVGVVIYPKTLNSLHMLVK